MANFNARLGRIEDPKNKSYVDPETGMRIPRRLSVGQIKAHNFGQRRPTLMTLLVSVLLGAMGLMTARYLRFTYADIPEIGTQAQLLAMMDLGLAALMTFIIGGMLRQKTARHMLAQMGGIALMLVAMHNLVWTFPTEFAQVFSTEYVEQVRSLTEPRSIYVVGETFTL